MKRALYAVLALALVLVVVRAALEQLGKDMLARQAARMQADVAAERARLAALVFPPPLEGAPLDANAADALAPIFGRLVRVTALLELAAPPNGATFTALLAAHRQELDDLVEALRRVRCAWPEHGPTALPYPEGAHHAARLLLLSARDLEERGDPARAAVRCLDGVRLAAMIASGPEALDLYAGRSIKTLALRELGRVVLASPAWAALPESARLDAARDAERALAALEPFDATPARWLSAMRTRSPQSITVDYFREGLGGRSTVTAWRGGTADRWIGMLLPPRFLVGLAVDGIDDRYAALARSLDLRDRARADALFARWEQETDFAWNPASHLCFSPQGGQIGALPVEERTLRAALAIELRFGPAGRFPDAIDPAELPEDPGAAPAKLRYEPLRDGRGFRLRSVGRDGRAGTEDDVVFERTSPP